MNFDEAARRGTQLPQQTGNSVPSTGGVNAGNPSSDLATGAIGTRAQIIGIGHEDRNHRIFWRPELRGNNFTLLYNNENIYPQNANAYVLEGGTANLFGPQSVPTSQQIPGVNVRHRSCVVFIAAKRPYNIVGNILWGWIEDFKEETVDGQNGQPSTTQVVQDIYKGPPKPTPSGQWDLLRFTYFEGFDYYIAEVITGNLQEQDALDLNKEQKAEDNKNTDWTDGIRPPDPKNGGNPPGRGSPNDSYIDPETGQVRLRSQGRLILLSSTNLFMTSENGGREWRGPHSGPWKNGKALSIADSTAHVIGPAVYEAITDASTFKIKNAETVFDNTVAGGNFGRRRNVAFGKNGKLALDGTTINNTSNLASSDINGAAFRRDNSSNLTESIIISDTKTGTKNGVFRNPVITNTEISTASYWVGSAAANPQVSAQNIGKYFLINDWKDQNDIVWRPNFDQWLNNEFTWVGGNAIDLAQELVDNLNPKALFSLVQPAANIPVNISGKAELVDVGPGLKRAKISISWIARAPQSGEFQRWFYPYIALSISNPGILSPENPTWTPVKRYTANLGTPQNAPNSDSYNSLQLKNIGIELSDLANLLSVPLNSVINANIIIKAEHDDRESWTIDGPVGPDLSKKKMSIELILNNNSGVPSLFFTVYKENDPQSMENIDTGVDRETIKSNFSIDLILDQTRSMPVDSKFANASFRLTFPVVAWKYPIDFQEYTAVSPWQGMVSKTEQNQPVSITIKAPRQGSWLLSATNGKATLANFADVNNPSFTSVTDLPTGVNPKIIAGGGYFYVWKGNKIWRSEDGQTWIPGPDLPGDSSANYTLCYAEFNANSATQTTTSKYRRLVGFNSNTGLLVWFDFNAGSNWNQKSDPELLGRKLEIINFAQGRFWVAEANSNLIFWSDNGQDWKFLTTIPKIIKTVEVDAFS